MEARLNTNDAAFDQTSDDSDSDSNSNKALTYSPSQYLTCENTMDPAEYWSKETWQVQASEKLQEAMDTLDDRSKDILRSRWLSEPKVTLSALAKKYGISIERVRQLEAKVIAKIKDDITVD